MKMKIRKQILAVVAALMIPWAGWSQIIETDDPLMPDIRPSKDSLMQHINDLTSGTYRGRLAGTPSYMAAAQYVADVLQSYGLRPFQGSYIQNFEMDCNQIEGCTFNVYNMRDNSFRTLVLGSDFVCGGKTGVAFTSGQAVFCGYGMDHENYDEYQGMELHDRIAVVLSGVPKFLPSSMTRDYATLRDKALVAQRHGANALVVINLDTCCKADEVLGQVWMGEGEFQKNFPVILTTQICGSQLLESEPTGLNEAIAQINQNRRPHSFIMDQKFELKVYADHNVKSPTANVVAYLPGAERPENREYVVIGAHLDHVGMQGESCMFPGADDNASGVAAVMEVARMLTMTRIPPQRNVVFVFFAGAENQHEGSLVFLQKFKKLKYLEAFVNGECLGAGDSLVVKGEEMYPLLYEIADSADRKYNHIMTHTAPTSPDGDAAHFAEIGIPSIVVTTSNGKKHNHVIEDIPEYIDIDMVAEGTKLMFETIYRLSDGIYRGRSIRSRAYRF